MRIEVNNQQALRALRRLGENAERLEPGLRAVGQAIRSHVLLGFRTGTDPYGSPWLPLKLRQGRPLVDTGRLRSSITYRVVGNTVTIGTNLVHAPVHQFGATIRAKSAPFLVFQGGGMWFRKKQVTVPARPFFPDRGLPDAWADSVTRAIVRHLGEGV